MLICHCRAVNETTIRSAMLAGASTPTELADRCGAGSRCGGCVPALREILDDIDAGPAADARTSAA